MRIPTRGQITGFATLSPAGFGPVGFVQATVEKVAAASRARTTKRRARIGRSWDRVRMPTREATVLLHGVYYENVSAHAPNVPFREFSIRQRAIQ